MRIEGFNGTNTHTGGMNRPMATDSFSKNIQNQIANAQKELQELSSSKDMSIEEKMNKRQEIQQKIIDLNNQLRQHQIEMRREQQQSKSTSMDDMLGGTQTVSKAGKKSAGLSQASMQAIISADSAMAQVQVQSSVATKMEGQAGVLEAEIKLDGARGGNVEAKQEELADIQQKAAQAQSMQMNTLAEASKELEEAEKTEQNISVSNAKQNVADAEKTTKEGADVAIENVSTEQISETIPYSHVDVRL